MLASAYSGIPNKKLANGCPVFTTPGRLVSPVPKRKSPAGYCGQNVLTCCRTACPTARSECLPRRVNRVSVRTNEFRTFREVG